jgi:hypothetical protein
MASTVSSVQHHPVGLRLSRGAVTVRCTHTRRHRIARDPASQDIARPKCHYCSCAARQITANPTTIYHHCMQAAGVIHLSISRVSTGYSEPPASTRVDYRRLRFFFNNTVRTRVEYCARAHSRLLALSRRRLQGCVPGAPRRTKPTKPSRRHLFASPNSGSD